MAQDSRLLERLKTLFARLNTRLSPILRRIDGGNPLNLAVLATAVGFVLVMLAMLVVVAFSDSTPNVQEVDSIVATRKDAAAAGKGESTHSEFKPRRAVALKEPSRRAEEASAKSHHWIASVLRPGDRVLVSRRQEYSDAPSNQLSRKPYQITHLGSEENFLGEPQIQFIAGSTVKLVSGESEWWLDADQIAFLRFEQNSLPRFGPDEEVTGVIAMLKPNSTAYFAVKSYIDKRTDLQPPFDVFIGPLDKVPTTDIYAGGRVVHVSRDFVAFEGADASYVLPSDSIGLLETISDSN